MARDEEAQIGLFGDDELHEMWEEHWGEMPEYNHKDLSPVKQVIVSFNSRADMAAFSELVGQKIGMKTQSIWYPAAEITSYVDKRYEDEERAAIPAVYSEQEPK